MFYRSEILLDDGFPAFVSVGADDAFSAVIHLYYMTISVNKDGRGNIAGHEPVELSGVFEDRIGYFSRAKHTGKHG